MNLNNSLRKTPVAVIGLSAIFADARNVEEFWTNIVQAKNSITDVPGSRWRIDDYYDPDMTVPDKTYCKKGGFLPEIDFNPLEFGLPPNILEVTDVSQLLGLVAARDALQDAGYGKNATKFTAEVRAKTGVLLGVGGGQKLITPLIARLQYPIWEKALRASGVAEEDIPHIVDKMKKAYIGWNENSFPGLLGNVISGRITNRFDLGGINSVVDAACAASLSAIKMSLSELVEGRCDMMLTGGVDTDNSPFMFMSFSKTPAFSKSGNIRPFDANADGMLIGEGLGMLVLKRLADAERDGDRIYAVIKGVGTSSDGRFKSVYAPRSSGQALAMQRAYEEAGYEASTVGLIEAHGTGTGAGDPTEFNSMKMVFGEKENAKKQVALGSVKSQIGHTKAAAGAAGMIKAVLALHHKILPPTINVTEPNPKFEIDNAPIYINTETRPWMPHGYPRRAGVSAFGFGGINVHIAMEEYTAQHENPYRLHQPYRTILLHAANPEALRNEIQEKQSQLQSAEAEMAFHELVTSLPQGVIPVTDARLGFVASSIEECIAFLDIAVKMLQNGQSEWSHPKGVFYRANGLPGDTKVVALFSGQGAQYVNMGRELTNAFPELAQAFSQMDETFRHNGGGTLSEVVYPIPVFTEQDRKAQAEKLTDTKHAQPAIGTLSMGMYKILKSAGLKPAFTAGHSFGELTALWAAGVYNDATFMALAKARGAAMDQQTSGAATGTMLAVKGPYEQVQPLVQNLEGVRIANHNSTNQLVLGGSKTAIDAAAKALESKGFTAIPLPVSAAFHTEFVEHAQKPFAQFVAQQPFASPQIPVYSNTNAQPYPAEPEAIKGLLQQHILKPVFFKDQIEKIYQDGGRIFVEFGPKGILTNLVKDILNGQPHQAIALNANAKRDSDLQFRQAVTQMQVLGLPIGNVDPYYLPGEPPVPKAKLTVKLSGNNYVSPPTQKAYQEALNDGFQISGGGTTVVEKPVIKEVEKIVEVPVEKIVEKVIYQNSESEDMNQELIQLLKSTLDHFKNQQAKTIEVLERFLNDQKEQSQQLLQMLNQQLSATQNQPPARPLPNGKTNGNGAGNIRKQSKPVNIPPIVDETPATKTTQPEPQPKPQPQPQPVATAGLSQDKLSNILLSVISEKTGYPAEMLELGMDMEADLGIDSIKRVEIFGAMTEQYPEVSGINPQELTELRTLGQIVDYIAQQGNGAVSTPTTKTTQPQPEPHPVTSTDLNQDKLSEILLTVISEKTGYPAEMLELGMDMEADLGIDSIKRVEIFGAMTEQYPEVSGINPQELTELRTLGQIVDYIAQQGNGAVSTPTTKTTQPEPQPQPESQPEPKPHPVASTDLNQDKLSEILLTVISEKTGYPAEMLELSMDMEADLGIDSIKRVEIFGAMTEQYPEVSGINPQELTELRTLGQIVDYIAQQGKKKQLV